MKEIYTEKKEEKRREEDKKYKKLNYNLFT